jgi:hypothetical protein
MTGAAKTPGFAGFKFLLSPRHPAPDICDLLASQNLYGLGPGVYPDAKTCPWPAHPNTLSFVNMVFASDVTAADKAGKETPLQAMGRLSADVRDGVLGKTKATYFDKGLLGQGAIRSPLQATQARLERQAAAVASAPMNDAYEVAKAGGKHSGLIARYGGLPDNLVEKSIRSLDKRIAEHEAKIAKPRDFVDTSATDTQIAFLVNSFWPKEIATYTGEAQVLRGILKDRKHG